MFRATFYFTKLTGLFFVQSAGILLSANVVGKDKSALGVERLVRLRLYGTELFGGVAGPAAGAAVAGGGTLIGDKSRGRNSAAR